jgi:hypothetical protein
MAKQVIDLFADEGLGRPAAHGFEKVEASLSRVGRVFRRLDSPDQAGARPVIVAGIASQPGAAYGLAKHLGAHPPNAPEALAIQRCDLSGAPAVAVTGSDSQGLMYALLDVAERIGWAESGADPFEHVRTVTQSPFTSERSMSIYTMHREVWERRLHDRNHWVRTFEMMAASRLNSFAIIFGYENGGFMAPAYPYFFDVPGFPDVRFVGLGKDEQEENVEAFCVMIDIAHAHGIRVIAGLWDHIYRGSVQNGGMPNAPAPGEEQPGIVVGVTGENVAEYNREAIGRFLEVFPEIDGLQLRMHNESGLAPAEMGSFWHGVFQIIKKERPGLKLDLRAKELPDSIIDDAIDMGLDVRITTKFWMEQIGLPFHPTHVNVQNQHDRRHSYADLLRNPQRFDIHWRLWNSVTSGGLLWADPDWVRRFVVSTRLHGSSFEFNEPNATWMLGQPHDTKPLPIHTPPYRWYRYEVERHWHTLQLFGRLGYDPSAPAQLWERELTRRFGPAGIVVGQALHAASTVANRIVAAAYCYPLFPTTMGSACRDSQGRLSEFALAEGSDIQQFVSFREEADIRVNGGTTVRRRPGETARWFESTASRVLALVGEAERIAVSAPELTCILTDARVLAHLARFYAKRIPAAVAYNVYSLTGDLYALDDAVQGERAAVHEWRAMVDAAGLIYGENLPVGIRRPALHGHWRDEGERLVVWLAELESFHREQESSLSPEPALLAHVPVTRLSIGEDLVVRATVRWRHETKRVNVTMTGDTRRRWPMEHREEGRYNIAIPANELPDRFGYVIEAQSRNGHRITTPGGIETPISVIVSDDCEAPHIEHTPMSEATVGQPVRIRVKATDQSGIAWIRLRYRHLCQYEDFESTPMRENGDGFEAAIPADYVIPEWDLVYFVEAMDTCGNGAIYPDLELETPYFVVPVLAPIGGGE